MCYQGCEYEHFSAEDDAWECLLPQGQLCPKEVDFNLTIAEEIENSELNSDYIADAPYCHAWKKK